MRSLRVVLGIFLLAALALSGTTGVAQAADTKIPTVSTEELKGMVDAKRDFTLIDARTPAEYADAHIVTAISVPESEFERAAAKLPQDKGALLVFYCNGIKCGKSAKVAAKAQKAGYTNLLIYSEGFPVWEEKGLSIVTGPHYDNKVKTVRVSPKDVAALVKEHPTEYVLVDVRETKEFAEGHIPGAINIPLATFAANSGVLPKEKGIIVYCNTGRRSYQAYRKLMKLAYPSIMQATFAEWKDSKLPISQ